MKLKSYVAQDTPGFDSGSTGELLEQILICKAYKFALLEKKKL